MLSSIQARYQRAGEKDGNLNTCQATGGRSVSGHYTAVIYGVVHDTYDPQREIAEFRQFPGWETAELKPGEQRNQNGIFTIRRRCVYGYWRKRVHFGFTREEVAELES